MILCDLPYGETNNPRDKPVPFAPLWEQYTRIIKENGAIMLFGQGKFFIDLVESNRAWYRYDLIWDKVLTTGFLNANRMPLRRHEKIAVFYKNGSRHTIRSLRRGNRCTGRGRRIVQRKGRTGTTGNSDRRKIRGRGAGRNTLQVYCCMRSRIRARRCTRRKSRLHCWNT